MSFSEWSNNKKKKKQGSSFSEWSDSQHKISAEQEREDARKREAYLASREDDIAPVRDTLTIETTQDIYDKYGKYFYESDFADLSKPTGSKQKDVGWKFWEDKGDDVYDFINDINKYRLAVGSANNSTLPTEDGETYRDAFDRMLLAQQNGHQNYGMPDAGAPYGDYTKYSHMTKFEVAVYNYLYSSKGKDAAQEFLNDLESALTYRQGATEAEEIQGLDSGIYKTLRYTEESIGGGLEQFGIGVKQLFSEEQLPTTAGEITNALLLEDLDGWKKNLYSAGNVIGNMAPSLAVGAINPTAGMALQGASGGGNAYRQALAEGKTEGEAKAYGVMMGSMEFLTSKLLGGVAGMTGNLPSKALSKVSTFSNSLLRVGAKYGISLASEVTEEELQLWLEPAVRSIAFGEDYDAPELEEMAETAIVTMISTGVLNSSTDIATGQFTKVNGLSVNEAKVIEAEVNNRVAEAEADGKKLTGKEKEKIRDKVVAEAQRGYISTDTIESVLGGNSYENYKNLTEQENTLKSKKTELENEIKELVKTPEQQFTIEQRERLDSLREEAKGIKEQIKGLDTKTAKTNLFNEVLKLTEKDTKLRDVMERSTQKLDIDVSKYDGVAKKTVENAIKAGANNTTRVRDFVEFAAKISNETGFEVDYGRDASFEETRAKLDVDRVNESISDKSKKIILNMDSATALNDLLGHAVTHKTEKAAHYAELQKAFQDFIGEDAYKAMKAYTSDTYKNQKSAIPDNEITAKLSGQYLFTDEKFIKRLSTEHQNLFQFVFDEIKHWARMANAGSKEARQLEKIMHLYEKCYREAFGELKAQGQAVNAEMASTSYALVGKNENGQDVYVSSPEVMAMSKPDRIKKFRNDFLADFRGRTAKFERNGHTYYVRFVESMKGLGKLAYEGESKSSPSGLKAKIRVLADGNAFELVEDPSYLDSEKEKRKTTQAHKKAEYWDYYYKTVVVDGKGYDVYIDIRNDVENGDYSNKEPFVYSIRFEDNKNVATSVTTPATQNSEVGVNLDATTDDIIPQNSEKSSDKENFSLSKDSNGNITDQSTDYAYGETYYTMSYKQDGKVVGTLEYGEYEGQPNVKMIQVLPEYRRKGIGTKLLQELQRKYPNQEIDFGMSTPDGTKLLESVTYDVTDDAVVADRQKLTDLQSELDELQAKLDVLYDTENLTEEQEAEMHRLGDRWEEVYHAINELEPELRGKKASKTFVRTDDTQFSLSANPRKADADYIKAVESGDTETAQKMVDEAAKNAGYSIKAYHGTGYDFTVFDKSKQGDNYQDWGRLGKGFYFAPTSREAETWAELSKGGKNKVMPVYLSSKNMLDSFEALPDNLKDTIPENWDSLTRRLAEKYAYNYIEYMQEFGYDVQKILTEKGYDGINGHTEFVVYDPEQVKSADAITYDDSQNVIPLSQRFDSSKTDIRFSLSNGKNTPTPQGNFYVYGKDFTVKSDIAPVREDIAPDTPTAENVTAAETATTADADIFPDYAPATAEEVEALNKQSFDAITDADVPPEVEHYADYLDDSIAIDSKSLKQLSKTISDRLALKSRTSRKELEQVMQEHSKGKYATKDDLYTEIEKRFGVVYTEERREDVADAKEVIRSMPLYVSPATKADFGTGEDGYIKFFRSNFGKLKFSKQGMGADQLYQGLSEVYPHLFPADIWNEAEQLRRIAEVANMDAKYLIPEPLGEKAINEVTDYIYDSVQEYKETERLAASFETLNAPIDESLAPPVDESTEAYAPINAPTIEPEAEGNVESEAPQKSNLEVRYEKINKQLKADKVDLAKEFAKRKAEAQKALADKSSYISNKALELYKELQGLTKGVRASADLGYLLDHGYSWKTIKTALINAKNSPNKMVNFNVENENYAMESIVREMLNRSYEDAVYGLDNMDAEYQQEVAKLEADAKKRREAVREEAQALRRADVRNAKLSEVESVLNSKGFSLDSMLDNPIRQLSTLETVDTMPQRVMEKTFGYEAGQALADATVNKIAQNETEGIKWHDSITNRKTGLLAQLSKQYNIKPESKEIEAAQMYAEGSWVDEETGDEFAYGDAELAKDFPDAEVQNNIKALVRDPRIRQFYDETLDAINEARKRNGYPEIPRRNNYYLHYRELGDFFTKNGLPFNPNDIRAKDLPTDMVGRTADLKPGQPYFTSSMQRKGKKTSYDLYKGIELYANMAKNQIYHIDDIQTLRALHYHLAERFGQAQGLENLDRLDPDQASEQIKKVFGSHLSTFAAFLDTEANILAGKTSMIDRAFSEGLLGRRILTFADSLNKQTGAGMVGYSVSSPFTNLLPVVREFAKSNPVDSLKALTQTVANIASKGKFDSFREDSSVYIRRKGADRFNRTLWQKLQDPGYALMSAVDEIGTEIIARTEYNKAIRKGMSEKEAHYEADKKTSRLMADRSLGQMPQMYTSRLLGLVTKFQLEVRNDLDSMFYDTLQEKKLANKDIENALAKNAKTAAQVAWTYGVTAIALHAFGQAFEKVAGYNPAFDIVEAISKAFGWDDDEESEDTLRDNLGQGAMSLLEDLPYASIFLDGGRVPISSALPDFKGIITGKDEYGNEKSLADSFIEIAPYMLPAGGNQLKKTVQGLGMFSDDHPVAGSYTDSGNLRFPVEDTPLNRLQAGLFGQYASKNAREYFDNDYAPLKEKQIQEYIDVDMPIKDYWEYRKGLSDLAPLPGNESVTLNQKGDYIGSLDLPVSKKNILINNIADRSKPIDFTGYENYSDFEEFDFATRFPEKYAVLKEQGISVADYKANYEETAFLYTDDFSWAANNPEKYTLSKAVTNDVEEYKRYTTELYNIEPDKDSNGKSISGSRKEKVLDYINNLDLDYGAKLILFKSEFPSDKTYNYDIINYVNSRSDLTYEDRVTIYRELGFKVTSDGGIYAE